VCDVWDMGTIGYDIMVGSNVKGLGGHERRRPMEAPVRRVDQMGDIPIIKGSGKPRIKRDLDLDGLSKELVLDTTQWRCSI